MWRGENPQIWDHRLPIFVGDEGREAIPLGTIGAQAIGHGLGGIVAKGSHDDKRQRRAFFGKLVIAEQANHAGWFAGALQSVTKQEEQAASVIVTGEKFLVQTDGIERIEDLYLPAALGFSLNCFHPGGKIAFAFGSAHFFTPPLYFDLHRQSGLSELIAGFELALQDHSDPFWVSTQASLLLSSPRMMRPATILSRPHKQRGAGYDLISRRPRVSASRTAWLLALFPGHPRVPLAMPARAGSAAASIA